MQWTADWMPAARRGSKSSPHPPPRVQLLRRKRAAIEIRDGADAESSDRDTRWCRRGGSHARSFPLIRRSNTATSLGPMHRLSSSSRALSSFMISGPARWWRSDLARRFSPRTAAPNPPARRVSRLFCGSFPHGSRNMASSSGVKGEVFVRPDRGLVPSPNDVLISLGSKEFIARYGDGHREDERRAKVNIISGEEDACRASVEVIDSKHDTTGETVDTTGFEEDRRATKDQKAETVVSDDEELYPSWAPDPIDGVSRMPIFPNSSHRDGSIFRGTDIWKKHYHIADRNETLSEAMMYSDPADCYVRYGPGMIYRPNIMMQIISLKLAKIHVGYSSVELYGYIAVRERWDPLLNYVVKFSRDDPMIVEQGSLLNMTGPKRGILLTGTNLVEFDMRIKRGEQEKDDLQLIDGVSIIDRSMNSLTFTHRILGDCGAIDITASVLYGAVEATVEVIISEVKASFNMYVGCFTSGLHNEIRLFDGMIGESRGLKRSVVAVVKDNQIDLKFKIGTDSSSKPTQRCCSFKACLYGHASQELETDFALISVKVTWSTVPLGGFKEIGSA